MNESNIPAILEEKGTVWARRKQLLLFGKRS
jgi:hypothetical protein